VKYDLLIDVTIMRINGAINGMPAECGKTRVNCCAINRFNSPWYVNDTLRDLNVPYVGDEIKKLSQRYADRLEKHLDILAIDLLSDAYISLDIYSSKRLRIVKCITKCYAVTKC